MNKFLVLENENNFSDLDDVSDTEEEDKEKFPAIEIPRNYSFRQFYNVYNYLSSQSPFGMKMGKTSDDLGETRMDLKILTDEVKNITERLNIKDKYE
jgi:hypothetical protein